MKNIFVFALFTFLFSGIGCAQTAKKSQVNLDFEQYSNDFPSGWESFGSSSYSISSDSIEVQNGRFSISIENSGLPADFKALAFNLPENYKGKSIQLSGYIKTENVTEGYAGLWMRIDPQIAFDNMNGRGVTGTTDWNYYEVTLPLNPKSTDRIVVGGLLVGKGKMWLDNLKVSIDGKDLNEHEIEIYKAEVYPAQLDKEFDLGSKLSFPSLDAEKVSDLELLGKIWGFVKYHHPEIANGQYNWDYELFRMLPDYFEAKTIQDRDKVLTSWLGKYGTPPPCNKCKPTPDDAVLKPDHSWIEQSTMSPSLKRTLKEIYTNRNQGEHYYIGLQPGVGNPIFQNENAYSGSSFPDPGFRLLSLYRYWNIIEYFFPNRHLSDKDWKNVLKEYIPKFVQAENELEYELLATQLIGEINDTHANLWGGGDKITEMRGNKFAPIRAEFVEEKYVVTDYYSQQFASESHLKIGDVISHINGKSIESLVDSMKPYYPASNRAAMLRDISIDLLRSSQPTLTLTALSDGQTLEHELTLYDRNQLNMYHWYKVNQNEKCYKLLEGNIGYITLANIKEEDIPEIKKAFKDTKGIVIDIRNYPSTFVPFTLGSYFMSELTAFVKFTIGNIDNPGEFTFTSKLNIPKEKEPYLGKLMILVNENSQSQAEYTAMAFKASKNSTVIGSTTAGADGNVSEIFLPGGLRTMISGIGVYYPDGTETQRVGIVLDVVVSQSIEGIKKGEDEVLLKAIELINTQN